MGADRKNRFYAQTDLRFLFSNAAAVYANSKIYVNSDMLRPICLLVVLACCLIQLCQAGLTRPKGMANIRVPTKQGRGRLKRLNAPRDKLRLKGSPTTISRILRRRKTLRDEKRKEATGHSDPAKAEVPTSTARPNSTIPSHRPSDVSAMTNLFGRVELN